MKATTGSPPFNIERGNSVHRGRIFRRLTGSYHYFVIASEARRSETPCWTKRQPTTHQSRLRTVTYSCVYSRHLSGSNFDMFIIQQIADIKKNKCRWVQVITWLYIIHNCFSCLQNPLNVSTMQRP